MFTSKNTEAVLLDRQIRLILLLVLPGQVWNVFLFCSRYVKPSTRKQPRQPIRDRVTGEPDIQLLGELQVFN